MNKIDKGQPLRILIFLNSVRKLHIMIKKQKHFNVNLVQWYYEYSILKDGRAFGRFLAPWRPEAGSYFPTFLRINLVDE